MGRILRKGGVGALMDEYERAADELARIVSETTDEEFEIVRDLETKDEPCRSIQTIMSHVVQSGFSYADYLRRAFAMDVRHDAVNVLSRGECLVQLGRMLAYTAETLEGRWEYSDDQVMAVQVHARWGPHYDLEQLLEHAIVHLLRHRRQIQRFLA